jgi:Carboxypeptidase regulatory-like domain
VRYNVAPLVKGLSRIAALCLVAIAAWAIPFQAGSTLAVSALDPAGLPAPGIRIRISANGGSTRTLETGVDGRAVFADIPADAYRIEIAAEGFQPVSRNVELAPGDSRSIDIALVALARRENIEVKATVEPVAQGATTPDGVKANLARELPSRPTTVSDALPLVPGVIREPGGALLISASGEHRSALVVNSADVTDPGTGGFGLTVPIDSVESLNVYQTPYLAEFGRFTAGLVSVETRRGGEKWKWDLNDPLPEFRIRSWHLRGLKTATPRLNFEGPLIPNRLYFTEGFEYEVRRTSVYTLPFPHNQKKEEGVNSFSQLDWVTSSRNLLTATAHIAPRRLGFANLDYFNPEETSPDASVRN